MIVRGDLVRHRTLSYPKDARPLLGMVTRVNELDGMYSSSVVTLAVLWFPFQNAAFTAPRIVREDNVTLHKDRRLE
jgi:hypothetical protein